MKIAFYLGRKGGMKDKAIASYTHGPYSHVEFVVDETDYPLDDLVHRHDIGGSLCYSSSSMAPRHGCGFELIDLADGKWDVYQLPPANWAPSVSLAIVDSGRPYDWRGIVGFVLPHVPDNREERFCSEEVTLMLQAAGYLCGVDAVRTSPNELARLLRFLL